MYGSRIVGGLLFVCTMTASAFGGVPQPPRDEPEGALQPPEAAKRRLAVPPALEGRLPRFEPAPMALSGGKLYIVTGDTLRRLDALTLAEEAKVEIPGAAEAERDTLAKEAFLKRFDRNADGALTEDELERPELLKRLDRDGDGKVSISEVPPVGTGLLPPAPASLLVEGGSVYVARGGSLYRFSADDLSLQAKVELSLPGEAPRPVLKRLLRDGPGQARERDDEKALKKRARDLGRDNAAPAAPPEDPVRF